MKEKILLHICCAPCLIYPLKKLREMDFQVHGFFYNPNLFPSDEFFLREKYVREYTKNQECKTYFYDQKQQISLNDKFQNNKQKPDRCLFCWHCRLSQTAKHARENGFKIFSTTLLVSPYQDKNAIKQIAYKIAKENQIDFFYYDFSEGYQEAVRISKLENLYRQKYCGCKYSLDERKAVRV